MVCFEKFCLCVIICYRLLTFLFLLLAFVSSCHHFVFKGGLYS